MLDEQTNELLCRVGPGTPMGDLLRRYWMPIAPKAEVDEKVKRPVKLLGEDLLVFKDGSGRYGLIREQCSHRGASLCYGIVDEDGIRCPYHGWKFDVAGRCLDQPAEPPDRKSKDAIRHPSYPVESLGGLLFGYLGPAPAPLLPRYDILVREDWVRRIEIHPVLDCNWLQPMENSVDPAHLYWLHGFTGGAPAMRDERIEFEIFEYGIYKYHYGRKRMEVHPVVFPNILRGTGNVIHYRIPMDDTHTRIIYVIYSPTQDGKPSGQREVPHSYIGPIKEPYDDAGYPRYRHHMKTFASQDGMAWETQGPIADRTREHLVSSDRGVVMFRQLLRIQLEAVRKGEDPMGVI
ncbi:MAG TPA: Rieske 2Fe-2S domain-containing protein, partial [Candidatus Binatia bacterium]